MPNLPSPYDMRDWREVAIQYDAYIYDLTKSGQFLPLVEIKSAGYNDVSYKPILLDTYVGTTSFNQAEAINIIPSIVSASLVGVNKTNQQNTNWVEKVKDFYNSKNGEHVYLNGYNAVSGGDWWYDVMPNIFFYQLYDLYPETPGFNSQFETVADQWLEAVQTMGGSSTPWTVPTMNFRAWKLKTMTGNTEGVKEPEAAGGIAWLLYNAYKKTRERKYLDGAQQAMEFLSSLTSNPSYELQLPYGAYTAARMNAEIGTNYDISKIVNWTFDRGPLRGWGTIVGKWDGKDVSGLIGEANDQGNDYAFLMNGFQHAAALVPLVKYDKRFARDIGKWILNLSNASRLLYPEYLAQDKQDDFAWSNTNDPQSVIAYEALKQSWEGKALYGTGDAKRNGWAQTNLGLYGSSHVGYLGAIVETTDVEGILKLNLNSTDFFGDPTYASFLFYNPHAVDKQVTLTLSGDPVNIYDAISETNVSENVSGSTQVTIKAGEAVILSYLPVAKMPSIKEDKLYVDDSIIDFHYGYSFEPNFRIKSFGGTKTIAAFADAVKFYIQTDNAPGSVLYEWFINDTFYSSGANNVLDWNAPVSEGQFEIKVEALSNGQIVKDSLVVTVVEVVPEVPTVLSLSAEKKFYLVGEVAKLKCLVENADQELIHYNWTVPSGNVVQDDSLLLWTVPQEEGLYTVFCEVVNQFDLKSTVEIEILVKSSSTGQTVPFIYFPLNLNVNDYSGNNRHAQVSGTQEAVDAVGVDDYAYRFSNSDDIIFVPSASDLNFMDAITISFWINASAVDQESFIVSHGSWEERWKVSLTPTKHLRWTIKTQSGTKDLDSSLPVTLNEFNHYALSYTGYSMELYINGVLNVFLKHEGNIATTAKALSIGQKSVDERSYYFNGIIDEVRLYDKALQPNEINLLQTLWTEEAVTSLEPGTSAKIFAFPNPIASASFRLNLRSAEIKSLEASTVTGKKILLHWREEGHFTQVDLVNSSGGVVFLTLTTSAGDIVHLKLLHGYR